MPVVAAFDLSLTATGWAHSSGRSGVLEPPKLRGIPRLQWIREQVLGLAANADLVVLEGYAFGAKGAAVVSLGELGGVIRVALADRRQPYVEIPPSCLKLFATGKGNAPKDEVFAAAIRRLSYAGCDHNEADALWLLDMERTHRAGDATQIEARALAKIVWPAELARAS